MTNKRLLLIDGSSYLFRAYYALPPLNNDQGMPTGAMYGVLNMLKKTLDDESCSHIAMVFDSKGKNFRHDLYPNYKANRGEMPEELAVQIEPLHQMIEAMGVPLIKCKGVEADDIIGTLVRMAQAECFECVISTGDKDFAQLVGADVTLLNTMSNTRLDEAGVIKKFGVSANQIIDYLALVGDSVDNIPGIPKVGPKTAAKWLDAYGSVDQLVENAGEIKGKVGEYLRENLEQLALSQQLVTIRCDIALDVALDQLQLVSPDHDVLTNYYKVYGFKRWYQSSLNQKVASKNEVANKSTGLVVNYQCITDDKACEQIFRRLKQSAYFVLDVETTGLDPRSDNLVGLAFSIKVGEAYYIPLGHTDALQQCDQSMVLNLLQDLLGDSSRIMVGHHLKFDVSILMRHGIDVRVILHDTLLQDYVLDSNNHSRKLDDLVAQHLNHDMIPFDTVMGEGDTKKNNFSEVDVMLATQYAAEDADMTLRLYEYYQLQFQSMSAQQELLNQVEWPLIKVLAAMENTGVLIDDASLKQQSKDLKARVKYLEEKIYGFSKEKFNISSTKQLRAVLFDELALPVIKKTPSGAPSTNEDVLQQLRHEHDIAGFILDYRALRKLITTYTDTLADKIHPATGRIHTSYHQTGTATGRLSSSHPNLQNIPVRSPEGRKIRHAFVAQPGHRLVAADYSQVELRIMAHLSGEPNLVKAFAAGIDIHHATACELFDLSDDRIDDEFRRRAKAINFGLIYGMSAFGLARQLNISRADAQSYIDLYFQRYPKVKMLMASMREFAAGHGYVETILGRRLYIPNISSNNHRVKAAAERAAINAPMQGSAADLIKLAMINLQSWIENKNSGIQMMMQVHDELVFEVPVDQLDESIPVIQDKMENAMSLSVPLVVAVGSAKNWDDAH